MEDDGADGEENKDEMTDNTEVEAKPEFGKSAGVHAEEGEEGDGVGIPLAVFL